MISLDNQVCKLLPCEALCMEQLQAIRTAHAKIRARLQEDTLKLRHDQITSKHHAIYSTSLHSFWMLAHGLKLCPRYDLALGGARVVAAFGNGSAQLLTGRWKMTTLTSSASEGRPYLWLNFDTNKEAKKERTAPSKNKLGAKNGQAQVQELDFTWISLLDLRRSPLP